MTGMTRTAIRLAAAGTVLATVLAGGTALAETGRAGGKIPRDFLLHEPEARRPVRYPDAEEWKISNRPTKNLGFNPCDLSRPVDGGRVATRTVDYHAPEFHRGEQLVIYRSTGAARGAMAGLLAQVDRCKRVKSGSVVFKASARPVVGIGDQAARMSVQGYDRSGRPVVGGRRAVVVREGRALAIYIHGGEYHSEVSDAQFTEQLRDARKMAAKVCSLPGVC
ncbi:hypothetical protein [Streptosporangium sp. NPDC001681]|uniref:hypothetical protein n=1 Tax=Streptosporangium sp. NPDC001681 TaxID=3154395 RepID=UPI00331D08B3